MSRQRDSQFLDEQGFLVTEIETANGVHYLKERTRLQRAADEARMELRIYAAGNVQALLQIRAKRFREFLVNWFKQIAQALVRLGRMLQAWVKNYLHTTNDDTDTPSTLGRIQSHVAGASVAGDDSAEETSSVGLERSA